MLKSFFIVYLLFLIFYADGVVFAQDYPKIDPASIDVSSYTDEQILEVLKLYNLSELPEQELSKKAEEAGFSSSQIEILKSRLSKNTKEDKSESEQIRKDIKLDKSKNIEKEEPSKIYGLEYFNSANNLLKPDLKQATPGYYSLGASDKLILIIYGNSEVKYELVVSPEGYINIPYVGPIMVNGITIDQTRTLLRSRLSKVYPSIKTGQTSFQVFLKDIRTIRVTLIGEVSKPSMYNLSSLSTIASALNETGGPSNLGSLRKIDLIRDGKLIVSFDFYDFLQRGNLDKNFLLMDGDIIRVNPYQTRIYLGGSVKRSGYFELIKEENLNDAILYAGGFADWANKNLVTVYRIGAAERAIMNIGDTEIDQFIPQSSDSVVVNAVLNKFSNRVIISGSVYYPGEYSLNGTPTLSKLLNRAKLTENALQNRALMIRKKNDFTDSLQSFNVLQILKGYEEIDLSPEDRVIIYSIDSLKEKFTVQINGEINKPGVFPYSDNLRLSDLVLMAGGVKEAASSKRIEIGRRIRSVNGEIAAEDSYAIVRVLDLDKDFLERLDSGSDLLEPYDVVSVRKIPEYTEQTTVSIAGEVRYPGSFVISNRREKLSDLVVRAGGLKPNAVAAAAVLMRHRNPNPGQIQAQQNKLNLIGPQIDSTEFKALTSPALSTDLGPVGIKLDKALEDQSGDYNILLEPGDNLFIPSQTHTIQVFGAVNNSVKIIYTPKMKFKDVVNQSGGFSRDAIKSASYVIHRNGQSYGTKKTFFFRKYPQIENGTDVYVPIRKENQVSLSEVLGIGTAVSSGIVALLYLINLTAK